MKFRILLIGIAFQICIIGFAGNVSDTIKVTINLNQADTNGLKINVYPPLNIKELDYYIFPKSIPGIYEFLDNQQTRTGFYEIDNDTTLIKSKEINNFYQIDCNKPNAFFSYNVSSTVNRYTGISAEDAYYIKDSLYILNWHHLIGFFKQAGNFHYKIIVNKDSQLWGVGSLRKKILNDTTDVYFANNYKELIHNPILYSKPDTVSFKLDETTFSISCAGSDTLLNSARIKDFLIEPLKEILKHSDYKHKNYSFIYYSEYSITTPYLTGLEHPNSTLICYHTALLDNNILIGSSIHEFIHSIYAPLRIRSEVINEFNFITPKCDDFLWFYEGITEYLSVKILLNSGVFSHKDFLNELNLSYTYHKNIDFCKTSNNIYGEKEQELFDNFYTKGSLFALQLDIELMKLSKGETDLFDVMRKLQKQYNPENPFSTANFIKKFSALSGVDIHSYISENVNKKAKVDFYKTVNKIGYSLQEKKQDTLIWSYDYKKSYIIVNYRKNKLELALFRSLISKEQKNRKIIIKKIDNEPITWFNEGRVLNPKSDKEIELLINNGKADKLIKVKPKQISRKIKKTEWLKNENYETDLSKKFRNE